MGVYKAIVGSASAWHRKGLSCLRIDTSADETDEKERIRLISDIPAVSAGYQVLSPDRGIVYSTIETNTFEGEARGGVSAFRLDREGRLSFMNRTGTVGQLPCQISISPDGKKLFLSSYLTGCLTVHPVLEDGCAGPCEKVIRYPVWNGIDPSVHFSTVTADGRYLCVLNITQHILSLFEMESGNYSEVSRHYMDPDEDRRPRQIVFRGSCAYVLTELGKEILVFDFDAEKDDFLTFREQHYLYPAENPQNLPGRVSAAALKLSPDGRMLAGSVRAYDLITLFQIKEDGSLTGRVFNKITGSTPRDYAFTPDGKAVLVGAQRSDQLELYRVFPDAHLELMADPFAIPCPVCISFV